MGGLLRPWIRYFAGPGFIALGSFIPGWPAIPVVAIGWLLVAGSSWASDELLRRQDARHAIEMLLDHAVTCFEAASPTPASHSLRASVFLLDSEAQGLRMAYSTSGYQDAEKTLLWQRGQGCVGMAWERSRTIFAPEDVELPVSASDIEKSNRPWNMTEEQIRTTAETVASVVAVPIAAGIGGEFLGVFAVDDGRPLSESPLGNNDVPAAIEELADSVRGLLQRAGTSFPAHP